MAICKDDTADSMPSGVIKAAKSNSSASGVQLATTIDVSLDERDAKLSDVDMAEILKYPL